MPELVHGHAVVFPDCDFTAGAGGVSAPRELVIDAGDLARDAAGRGEEPKIHRWRNAADEREKAGALIAQLLLKDGVGLERVAIVGM